MNTEVEPVRSTRSKRQVRRSKAVRMRIAGHSPEDIAAELGYVSPAAASADIYEALAKQLTTPDHNVEILREIECKRLDMMLLALHPGIERGNPRSVEIAIRILERRAKMMGLDSATKVELLTVDDIDAQIAKLTEKMTERAESAIDEEIRQFLQ
jgi:hypothetical protein